MLKRRKESDTYLATFHRHRWSAQMKMKKDNLLELSASTVTESSNQLSFFVICALQRCLWKVARQVSLSFLLFNIFFFTHSFYCHSIWSFVQNVGTNQSLLIAAYSLQMASLLIPKSETSCYLISFFSFTGPRYIGVMLEGLYFL